MVGLDWIGLVELGSTFYEYERGLYEKGKRKRNMIG